MARPRFALGEVGEVSAAKQPNGQWRARARYRRQDGQYKSAEAWASTKAEAREKCLANATKRANEHKSEIAPGDKLNRLIEAWWKTQEERARAEEITRATLAAYRRTTDMIVEGRGDTFTIEECTTPRLEAFVHERGGDHYTVHRDLKRVLTAIFDYAMRRGILTDNPARAIDVMRAPKREVLAYSEEEVQALREVVRAYETGGANSRQKNGKRAGGRPREVYLSDFVDLMLATGCRISEVLGLRWEDVDLASAPATITITGIVKTRKADPAKGLGYLYWQSKGKTPAAWRTIPLGKAAADILLRLHVGNDDGHEYVFANSKGGLRSPSNVRNALRTAVREAGSELPASKTHTLRKTVATLVEESEGVRTASLLLGHRSIATTEKHYVHRPSLAPDASARLDELLMSVPEPNRGG